MKIELAYLGKVSLAFALATIILTIVVIMANAEEMDLTRAVIHHSASHDVSAKTINERHIERGFDENGYHFLIRMDGSIEKGRNLAKKGAHAKGRNNLVGICLTGYDHFTTAQIESLRGLLKRLGIVKIEPHHQECPGKGLNLENIIRGED